VGKPGRDYAGLLTGDTHGDLFADDMVTETGEAAETIGAGVEAGENKEAHA
jgi:hypothetical protein